MPQQVFDTRLEPTDRDIARRLATAFCSIFQVAGWHAAGGVWLDDLLDPGRRIWLMDESPEASASEGLVIAMRVFDAGPFHAGFGLVVHPAAEARILCTEAVSRGQPLPVRHSLAAALYGDAILEATPPAALEDVADLIDTLAQTPAPPSPVNPRGSRSRRERR